MKELTNGSSPIIDRYETDHDEPPHQAAYKKYVLNEYSRAAGMPLAYARLPDLPAKTESFGYQYFLEQTQRNRECDYTNAVRCPCEPCESRRAVCLCVACTVSRGEDPIDGKEKKAVVRALKARAIGPDKQLFLELAALVNRGDALQAVDKAFHAGFSLMNAVAPCAEPMDDEEEEEEGGGKGGGGRRRRRR